MSRPSLFPAPIDAAAVVAALANTAQAAVPVAALAAALGCPEEAAWEAIGAAEALGLVESWMEAVGGPSATLSVLAAERLGLALDGSSRFWGPIFSTNGHANGKVRGAEDLDSTDTLFDRIIDSRVTDPLQALIDQEKAERTGHGSNGKA